MNSKTFYIETMGCQMNKLDSELIVGQLNRLGYEQLSGAEGAGVVIYNTCSVRQHAEDKVISKIGQFRGQGVVLAVVGCMAERLGQKLLDDYSEVDVVCAPGMLHKLGDMIERARQGHERLFVHNDANAVDELERLDATRGQVDAAKPFMSFVRAMRGCNNFCSYCIVPYVRGRERSRDINQIVEESRRLAGQGVKEITLLGQTVNSYKFAVGDKTYGLADVLERLNDLPGLERIRFVTSFPRDFDERIFEAMAGLDKVCEYLHMPAQSGSDRMLKEMNRRYTAAEYLELVERGRSIVPNLAVAGDFIVGYCGETEDDYQATVELVRKVRYKNCFIFKYSPRPGTKAEKRMVDDVPEKVKKRRNTELLEIQNSISLEDNQQFVGQDVEVLVEGPSKKPHLDGAADKLQLVGRTRGDHIVVFPGVKELIGELLTVRVVKVSALTLFGE